MNKLLVSLPCWGDEYVKKTLHYVIPSLTSKGNMRAILEKKYKVTLYIYTKEMHVDAFKANEGFNDLKKEIDIHFCLLEKVSKDKHIPFSQCHEDTLQRAIKVNGIVLFLCADGLITDGSLSMAIDKLEQGHDVVFQNSFRVNDQAAMRYLKKLNSRELSLESATYLILNHLHMDEVALAAPSEYMSDSWPGIPSWYKKGEIYIKHNPYYTTLLLQARKRMSLGGSTFDSCNLYDRYLGSWDKVFINDNIEYGCTLDLAPENKNQLKIKKGIQQPQEIAEYILCHQIHEWQYRTMLNKVVVSKKPILGSHPFIDESNGFMKKVDEVLSKKDLFDFKKYKKKSYRKYHKKYGMKLKNIERRLYDLDNEFRGKNVIFYGCGELFSCIDCLFNFKNIKVFAYDRSLIKRRILSQYFTIFHPEEKKSDIHAMIPISLEYEHEIKDDFRNNVSENIPVFIVNWKTYLD